MENVLRQLSQFKIALLRPYRHIDLVVVVFRGLIHLEYFARILIAQHPRLDEVLADAIRFLIFRDEEMGINFDERIRFLTNKVKFGDLVFVHRETDALLKHVNCIFLLER